jgi:hypothetical protein
MRLKIVGLQIAGGNEREIDDSGLISNTTSISSPQPLKPQAK